MLNSLDLKTSWDGISSYCFSLAVRPVRNIIMVMLGSVNYIFTIGISHFGHHETHQILVKVLTWACIVRGWGL